MTYLSYSNIFEEITDSQSEQIEKHFNASIIDRLYSGSKKKQMRQATSRLMLIDLFDKLRLDKGTLKNAYYQDCGKLSLSTRTINLSISYTENKAVCGISNSRLGIDIEDVSNEVSGRNKNLLEKFSKKKIESGLDFYKLWTKMESIAKLYESGGLNNLLSDAGFFRKSRHTRFLIFNKRFLTAISS